MTYGLTCLGPKRNRALGDFVDRTPVPLVARYKAWVDEQGPMFRRSWSGDQVRRIVVMRRRHDSFTVIAQAIGKSKDAVKSALDRLPPELQ